MFRRGASWRLAFASAFCLSFLLSHACAHEESQDVRLAEKLAFCWTILRENSLYHERLPDWQTYRDDVGKPPARGEQCATDEAISRLLKSVKDDYTYFRNREQTQKFQQDTEQRHVVSYRMLPENTAYIKIRTFCSKYTSSELDDALRTVSSADAFILDLRGNRGGLVDQAFQAYSMFVDDGVFATFKGRAWGDEYIEVLSVTPTQLKRHYNGKSRSFKRVPNLAARNPLIVLIDGETRSASEILAGALHDAGRCRLVGQRTFGKGVVQNSWEMDDGSSLRITIGRSYLSKSGCFDQFGLHPDVHATAGTTGTDDQLSTAMQLLSHRIALK